MKREIRYETIGQLSLKNLVLAWLETDFRGPYPLVKRFSLEDTKNMRPKRGVVESLLRPGEFVVIRRSKKLV